MKEIKTLRLKLFITICSILAVIAASFSCSPRIRESVEEVWLNGNPKKVIVYSCGKKFCNLLRTTYYFEDGQIQSDTFYDNGVPVCKKTHTVYY